MTDLTQNEHNTLSAFAINLVRDGKLTADSFDRALRYLADNVGGGGRTGMLRVQEPFTKYYVTVLRNLGQLPPTWRRVRLTACVAAVRDDGAVYPCFIRDADGLPWRRYGNCVAVNAELVRNTSALWPHSKGVA